MSRYLLAALLMSLWLGGCAVHGPAEVPGAKSVDFAAENELLMKAIYYRDAGKHAEAYALFDELYRHTKKREYRIEALKQIVAAGAYEKALKRIDAYLAAHPGDLEVEKIRCVALLRLERVGDALGCAKKIVELEPEDPQNVDLLASIYLLEGKNREAYDAYKGYYDSHHDDETVVKMASILFHKFKTPQEAIRLLQTHSKMIGCSEKVCLFLAELYRRQNDLEQMAGVYAEIYKTTRNTEYAKKAAEIYAYLKVYDKAEKLLADSGADDRLLLSIYKHTKAYDKAVELAGRLYARTSDPLWLAEHGILLYEAAENRNDPKLLARIIEELDEAFAKGVEDPLYYNYLGYLLIDHDIDPRRGIELVKKALAKEPESAYFIDSLAWGYYKIGRCEAAYREILKAIEKLGKEDKELKEHLEKINACRSRKK